LVPQELRELGPLQRLRRALVAQQHLILGRIPQPAAAVHLPHLPQLQQEQQEQAQHLMVVRVALELQQQTSVLLAVAVVVLVA
jgi:hypothetical protein